MYCETNPTGTAAGMAARFAALVPVLTTERLTLRAPQAADFALYAEIACGPRSKGIGGPMTRDEAWYDFATLASCWMLRGHGGWTITLTRTGAPIGFALIGAEPGDQAPELGYLLIEAQEGQGYATEAAEAVRDYAFGTLRLPELVSYIAPGNARSVAVAERLGAIRSGNVTYPEGDTPALVYRHPSPEDV
ncbi:N-acetyltransferase [Roseovarius faecimaris]|uniref:N-acetyltransferase n=2 Tax=Roseovarius faecimaris TaxID=2494550 RepID=A0A6I6IT66_9RHOB|nr:N-acetyltransferase [Roseovarius faecimaris]